MEQSHRAVTRRLALVWLSVGVATPILQTCTGVTRPAQAPGAQSGTLAAGGSVPLQALYSSQGPEDRDVFVKVFQAFHEHHPNADVNFTDITLT